MENKTTIKSINISGTYGDKVKLYLSGYINTKYGEMLKIKSVDIEKQKVDTYGGSILDFSRISFSSPVNKATNKDYLNSLLTYTNSHEFKKGSIIDLKYDGENISTFEIDYIHYPNCKGNFLITLFLTDVETKERKNYTIDDYGKFANNLIEIKFTPYTLEESLRKHLSDNSNYCGEIKDRETYIKGLLEIIEKHNG